MYLLSLGRYTGVSCNLGTAGCSNLELGLLDFGATYTFILMEVRFLVIQVCVQILPVILYNVTEPSLCVLSGIR